MNSADRAGNTVFRIPKKKKSVSISNTSNEAVFAFENVPKEITRKGAVATWRTNQNTRGLQHYVIGRSNTRRKSKNLNTSATNKQTRNASNKNGWSGILSGHRSDLTSPNKALKRAQRRAEKEAALYGKH
jgi:hypothetical protein